MSGRSVLVSCTPDPYVCNLRAPEGRVSALFDVLFIVQLRFCQLPTEIKIKQKMVLKMVLNVIPVLLAIVWILGDQPSTARYAGRQYGYREDTIGLCQIYNIKCPGTKVCMVQRLSHGPRPFDVPVCVGNKFLPAHHKACSLPPSRGECDATLIRWYYDSNDGRCAWFHYSGCQRNANNFFTKRICEQTCIYHGQHSKRVNTSKRTERITKKRKRGRKRKRKGGKKKKKRKIKSKHRFAEYKDSARGIATKPSAIVKTRIVQKSNANTKMVKKPSARPKTINVSNATITPKSKMARKPGRKPILGKKPGTTRKTILAKKPGSTPKSRIVNNPTSKKLYKASKNTNTIMRSDNSQAMSDSLIGYLRQRQLRHPSSMSIRREVASGRYFRLFSMLQDKRGQRVRNKHVNRHTRRHQGRAHG